MKLSIVGKLKSKATKKIVTLTPLSKYTNKSDIVVNYGLVQNKLYTKYPSIKIKPIINKFIGCNKYRAIKEAEHAKILVPKTLMSLTKLDQKLKFIVKKFHSQGGVGIKIATTKSKLKHKYYQEFINDRRYELRVHGFLWEDIDKWTIQKRLGKKEEIAWNYHNGGTFQSIKCPNNYDTFIKAKQIAYSILKLRNMAFGAVDLIVTNSGDIYFIEINSAPGFTKLSEQVYINAFNTLVKIPKKEILKYCK